MSASPASPDSTAQAAKDQASDVADSAQQRAADVASTAKGQAARVVGTVAEQAQHLGGQAAEQLDAQAAEQGKRLAAQLHQASDDLRQMAEAGTDGSVAHSIVAEIGQRSRTAGDYLERVPPRQMLSDLQEFGRRRPGVFIAGAAVAGLIVGRLGKSMKEAAGSGADAAGPVTGLPATPVARPYEPPLPPTDGSRAVLDPPRGYPQ